ncbi:hypothetical protein [Raoultibacter massiliensis]|uniref:hypothetical protein n=1 Tax=Raoultibacter massiliensis TaxID=1852371 RepID=UPI003A9216E0
MYRRLWFYRCSKRGWAENAAWPQEAGEIRAIVGIGIARIAFARTAAAVARAASG